MDKSLYQLEKQMIRRINEGYGDLIKEINQSLTNILQLSILTAEKLEESLKEEINEVRYELTDENSTVSRTSRSNDIKKNLYEASLNLKIADELDKNLRKQAKRKVPFKFNPILKEEKVVVDSLSENIIIDSFDEEGPYLSIGENDNSSI